ncbi:hypothetical protein J4Q44_G00004160, partial [Coregonus suidteri]
GQDQRALQGCQGQDCRPTQGWNGLQDHRQAAWSTIWMGKCLHSRRSQILHQSCDADNVVDPSGDLQPGSGDGAAREKGWGDQPRNRQTTLPPPSPTPPRSRLRPGTDSIGNNDQTLTLFISPSTSTIQPFKEFKQCHNPFSFFDTRFRMCIFLFQSSKGWSVNEVTLSFLSSGGGIIFFCLLPELHL